MDIKVKSRYIVIGYYVNLCEISTDIITASHNITSVRDTVLYLAHNLHPFRVRVGLRGTRSEEKRSDSSDF